MTTVLERSHLTRSRSPCPRSTSSWRSSCCSPPAPAGALRIGRAVGIATAPGVFVALASVIALSDEPALARPPLAGPPPTPLARFGGILRRSTVTDCVLHQGVPPHFGPWTVIARLAREGHCPWVILPLAAAAPVPSIARRPGKESDRAGTVCLVRRHDCDR